MAYGPVLGTLVSAAVEDPVVDPEEKLDKPFTLFFVGGPDVPATSFNAAATSGSNVPVIPEAVKREEKLITVPPALPSDSMPMKYAFVVAPPAAVGIDISAVVCVALNVPDASDVRRTFAS